MLGLVWSDPLLQAVAFIVAVLAVGRATRLLTHDDWPPVRAARLRWLQYHDTRDYNAGPDSTSTWRYGWGSLFTCPFCMAPWVALVDLVWAALTDVTQPGVDAWAWWLANLWFAVAYAAAIVVAYDEPPE